MAESELSCAQRLGARKQFDQRGFPRTVRSNESYSVAALDHEVDLAKDFFFPRCVLPRIALGDALEFGHNAPARLWLWEFEVDGLFFRRDLDALDLLEFLDAALDLLGLRCLVAEPVDEDLQLLDAFTLIAVRRV